MISFKQYLKEARMSQSEIDDILNKSPMRNKGRPRWSPETEKINADKINNPLYKKILRRSLGIKWIANLAWDTVLTAIDQENRKANSLSDQEISDIIKQAKASKK